MATDAHEMTPAHPAPAWTAPLLALGLALAALFVAFLPTFQSIVEIWNRSETFAHGFLIVPIVLFLIFLKRHELARLQPQPCFLAVVPIVLLSLAWVMGNLVDVVSVRQFAATLMIPAVVWLMLGTQVVRLLQFPLAYLLFAVPFGQFMVPPLMDFTADFTVAAVQLSGIPIYRDGLQFELPTGRWSVVAACSGVRYLIASVALGTLYAYLMYRSLWRRLAFVGVAIIVPIVANGLRAYMIVMIGHLSGMEHAVGVDHLLYGWVFFGVVIFLMFWIGTIWREDHPSDPRNQPEPVANATGGNTSGRIVTASTLAVVLAFAGPLYGGWMNQRDLGPVQGLDAGPVVPSGWQVVDSNQATVWEPGYQFARASRAGLVTRGADKPAIGLHINYYREQHNHGSMVGWANRLAGRDSNWSERRRGSVRVDGLAPADRILVNGPDQQIVAWRWYWVNGHLTTVPHEVKAREALHRLLGGRDDAALIVIHAVYRDDPAEVETEMRHYAEAALPTVLEHLTDVQRQ